MSHHFPAARLESMRRARKGDFKDYVLVRRRSAVYIVGSICQSGQWSAAVVTPFQLFFQDDRIKTYI